MPLLRLDKIIAVANGISRTDAAKTISNGSVTINDVVIKSSSYKADSDKDVILINQQPISYHHKMYILMNKPLGIVSSTDNHDGETVLDLLPEEFFRKGLFPAGRLDKYSEGMVVITDDGEFSHRMLSPKSHVGKTYYVEVDAPIMTENLKNLFLKGVDLGKKQFSSPANLEILSANTANITIHEGIYHQVRIMFDRNGGKVTKLVRIKIGNLNFDPDLGSGEVRVLTVEERELLLQPNVW